MLQGRSLIILTVAVLLGICAVIIANAYLGGVQQQAEQTDAGKGMVKIAVAASPLDFGAPVTPEKVRFVDWPSWSVPEGSFSSVEQLFPAGKSHVVLRPMAANEPILSSKLSGEGGRATLAALLRPEMRAFAVRVSDSSSVAGFVLPGDVVDVLITRSAGTDNAQQITDVLLQNVRVIAIDQEAKNSDGTPKVARTATLQVAPLDAQKLALGQQSGSLSLVLRKPGEQNNPVVETVSMNDLRFNMYGGARYPAPASVGGFGAAVANSIERSAALVASTNAQGTGGSRRSGGAKKTKRAAEKPSVEIYRGTTSNQYKVGG